MHRDLQKIHRAKTGIAGVVGYLLSPLSWWNDAYINLPIAYVISLPFLLIGKNAFLVSIVVVYWLSNIAGLILMHWSSRNYFRDSKAASRRKQMMIDLLVSVAYTVIVVALLYFDILPTPHIGR